MQNRSSKFLLGCETFRNHYGHKNLYVEFVQKQSHKRMKQTEPILFHSSNPKLMTQTNDFALCSQEPKLHLLSRSKHQSDNAPEIHGPFLKQKHMTAWTTLPKGSQVIDQPCLLSKSNHPSHWKCSRNPRSFLKTTTTKTTHTCTHNYIDCPPLKKKKREK